ncbi:MAG: hypothetical protein ACOC3T_06245 [Bacteroidota bacterium]
MKSTKIHEIEKFIPDAYHGAKAEYARNICENGFVIKSVGDDLFLGDGVYFYESSQSHAQDWGRKKYKGEVIGVVKALVNLGRCLDFHNKEHIQLVKDVSDQLKTRKPAAHITDAVTINFIAANFPRIDSVRATYFSDHVKSKVFKGSRFYEYNRLIVCVRNLKNIIKTTLSYEGR